MLAENGRGKTTLCARLRIATYDPGAGSIYSRLWPSTSHGETRHCLGSGACAGRHRIRRDALSPGARHARGSITALFQASPTAGAELIARAERIKDEPHTMNIFVQNATCPSQVLFAFDEVVRETVVRVRWAVAYSTRRGCDRLIRRISARMGQRQWERSEKQFVTSLDFGLTEPAALEFLAALPGSTVRVANPAVLASPALLPAKAYHPKLYLFDATDRTGFVVGSANLTESALITNTEVVAAGEEALGNGDWDRVWSDLLVDTTPLTSGLLAAYRQKCTRIGRSPAALDLTPQPLAIRLATTPIFWNAITAGGVAPMAFAHFWIEAGSMSSGGSHNQLELPRGGNRFFGFAHADYGPAHITMGNPTLTLRGRRWTNRPLTWHGNNKMERINLPTEAQGGFDYRQTAVLFRRHRGGFEINVLPWNDPGAVAWRTASNTLGTVFRLGERGRRTCGLF